MVTYERYRTLDKGLSTYEGKEGVVEFEFG